MDLDDDQILYTSGDNYNLDVDIAASEDVLAKVKQIIVQYGQEDRFTLLPYAVTDLFENWANNLSELGVSVFGETLDWISKYGHKGILHPAAAEPDKPSLLNQNGVFVPVPRGWFCKEPSEIRFALQRMKADGITKVGRADTRPARSACEEETKRTQPKTLIMRARPPD